MIPTTQGKFGDSCIIATSWTMPGTQRIPRDVFLCLIFLGNKNCSHPVKLGPHRLSPSASGNEVVIHPKKELCPAEVPVEIEGKWNGRRRSRWLWMQTSWPATEARIMADVFRVLSCFLYLPSLKHTHYRRSPLTVANTGGFGCVQFKLLFNLLAS